MTTRRRALALGASLFLPPPALRAERARVAERRAAARAT
jgi:hypothetical protein